jgi:drug/metabolite transporter (DMT)-like permease
MTAAERIGSSSAHNANLRGILAMMASMFALTLNFAFVKLAGSSLPVGEVLFLRGMVAATIIAIVAVITGAHKHIRYLAHRTVIWRTFCECVAASLFAFALMRIPIASATVIMQIMPLAITAGAALWLGEQVHWRRWAAIVCGFIGVVIVIQPGFAAFQWASLIVVVSVLLSSLRDLSTRRMPRGIPTVLVAFAASFALSLLGLSFSVLGDWVVPDTAALLQISGSGALLSFGLFAVVLAMREGELSIIAPFRYSAVLWATILGYLIWNDTPNAPTIVGALIIVGSGVYISYRERAFRATVPAVQTDAAADIIRPDDPEER